MTRGCAARSLPLNAACSCTWFAALAAVFNKALLDLGTDTVWVNHNPLTCQLVLLLLQAQHCCQGASTCAGGTFKYMTDGNIDCSFGGCMLDTLINKGIT